jgi:predicted metal-dependent hydrolase
VDSELYLRGIELFNDGQFFVAHEVLEDVWRNAPPPDKLFFQGLVQIAVAFVHHSRGNVTGACSLLERGCKNLSGYPAIHEGIDVRGLIESARSWRAALASAAESPPLPQIKR